jgi:hypothetical protein
MVPGTHHLDTHLKGDLFVFPVFQLFTDLNVTPYNLTGASAKMTVRKQQSRGVIMKKWDTANSTIAIVDATNGELQPQQAVISFPAGVYVYDLQITKGDFIQTVVTGTWTIVEDVT